MNNIMAKNILTGIVWIFSATGLLAQPYPGGIAAPCTWFQTLPVGDDRNGDYHWSDLSGEEAKLYEKGTTTEARAARSDIHTYNFNPALPFDSTTCREFSVKGSDLNSKTVVAVVGAKKQVASKDAFLYHIKGSPDRGRILSKTKVIRTSAEGKKSCSYTPNLVMRGDSAERVKIVSYLEGQKQDNAIWKSGKWAKVTLGGQFEQAWAAGDSSFTSDADSLLSKQFHIPEMIVYSRFLRPGERMKVETYLALKYGITLSSFYLSPKGLLLWNDQRYKYRIVGYGRDDRSSFYQERSTTSYEEKAYDVDDTYHKGDSDLESSSSNLIVMGFMGATSIPDSSYVLFADNNGPTIVDTIANRRDSIDYTDSMKVMKRVWKVRTYGLDSSYLHRLELGYEMLDDTAFALYRDSCAYLLVDRSGSDAFKEKVDTIRMTELDEERRKIIFDDVRLDSLCHFTFAYAGLPSRKKEPEKYDYFLELQDPTCNNGSSNNDGYLKLLLPPNEKGYYCNFNRAGQGGVTLDSAINYVEFENIHPYDYYLTVLPADTKTIDFSGTGTTFVNVHFLNNNGTIQWRLEDANAESKVAFVDISEGYTHESRLRYGVRIANGNLYVINNFQVENNASAQVNVGDDIQIERKSATQIQILKNGSLVRSISIANSSTFKMGVKTTDGNVSRVLLKDFNWGRGDFPMFFLDIYAFGVFSYSNNDMAAYPTGYVRYYIDFNVDCQGNQTSSGGANNTIQLLTDMNNRRFTASLNLENPANVTFFVFSINNLLLFEERTYAMNGHASKTFEVAPGEYIVIALTDDGRKFEGRTIIR